MCLKVKILITLWLGPAVYTYNTHYDRLNTLFSDSVYIYQSPLPSRIT